MRRVMSGAVAALVGCAFVFSCADSTVLGNITEDSGAPPTTVPGDAAVEEKPDVAVEAAAPTGARICSDDHWCHTEVPEVPDGYVSLIDIWGDEQGTVWAASQAGSILKGDGKSWSIHYTSPTPPLNAIWGSGSTELWAGGAAGLLHGDGTSWTAVTLGAGDETIEINDITGSTASGLWAVGHNDAFQARAYHRAPGSTTWERVTIPPLDAHPRAAFFANMPRAWFASNGDLWIDAIAQGDDFPTDYLFRLPAGSSTWTLAPGPAAFSDPDNFSRRLNGAGAAGDDLVLLGTLPGVGAAYWMGKTNALATEDDWKPGRWKHPLDTFNDAIRRYAVWGVSGTDLYAVGSVGRVQHWNGTAWTTERILIDGLPIADTFGAVWGRSSEDVWVLGGNHALHKVSKEEADLLDAEHARKDGGT